MFSLLTLFLEILFGYELVYYFGPTLMSNFIILSIGIPVGISISTFLVFLFSCVLGQNDIHLVLHTVILGLFVYYINRKKEFKKVIDRFEGFVFNFYFLIFISLLFVSILGKNNRIPKSVMPFIHEDFSLLASFTDGINSGFLNQFKILHPDQSGMKVVSRWIPAFHSSILMRGFLGLKLSMIIPSAFLFCSYSFLMYSLCRNYSINQIISFIAPFIPLFISGYGAFSLKNISLHRSPLSDYVSDLYDHKTQFIHPTLHIIIGSRSSGYTMSLVLAFLYVLSISDSDNLMKIVLCSIGFMFPGLFDGAYYAFFVFYISLSVIYYKKFPWYGFLSLVTPLLLHITRLGPVISHKNIWSSMISNNFIFPLFSFMFNGSGTYFFVTLGFSWVLLKRYERKIFLSFIMTFYYIFSNCFICGNQQIIYTILIPISLPFYLVFLSRLSKHPKSDDLQGMLAALGILLTCVNCFSSFLGLIKQLKTTEEVFNSASYKLSSYILKYTKKTDIFVAPKAILSPVTALCGRQVFFSSPDIELLENFNSTLRNYQYQDFLNKSGLSPDLLDIKYIIRSKNENQIYFLDESLWKDVFYTTEVVVYQRETK